MRIHRPRDLGDRRGFTLTELLVVIVIALLLAAAALPAALALNNGRQLRDASSTLQSTLAGARDRALGAQAPRGVRLLPDPQDESIVRTLQFIQPQPPMSTGSAMVVPSDWNGTYVASYGKLCNKVILMGLGGSSDYEESEKLLSLPQRTNPASGSAGFDPNHAAGALIRDGAIRLSRSGPALGFTATDAEIQSVFGSVQCSVLWLTKPLPGPVAYKNITFSNVDTAATLGVSYEIALGNVPSETDVDLVQLPAGVVIDLGYRYLASRPPTSGGPPCDAGPYGNNWLSQLRPTDHNAQAFLAAPAGYNPTHYWDIMFSPGGTVLGDAAADPYIALWVREQTARVQDVQIPSTSPQVVARLIPTNGTGNHSLVVVYPRTGLVQSAQPFLDGAPLTVGTETFWDPQYYLRAVYDQVNSPTGGEAGL